MTTRLSTPHIGVAPGESLGACLSSRVLVNLLVNSASVILMMMMTTMMMIMTMLMIMTLTCIQRRVMTALPALRLLFASSALVLMLMMEIPLMMRRPLPGLSYARYQAHPPRQTVPDQV